MANLEGQEEFIVGRQFDSYKEFNDMFSDWCARNFYLTRIEDSHKITNNLATGEMRERLVYTSVKVSCVHYGHRASRAISKEKTVQRSTFRRGCPFSISLKLVNNTLEIKQANFQHNHAVNALMYSRYPQNRKITDFEMGEIGRLLDMGVAPQVAVNDYTSRTGKSVAIKDVRNYLQKENKKVGNITNKNKNIDKYKTEIQNLMRNGYRVRNKINKISINL